MRTHSRRRTLKLAGGGATAYSPLTNYEFGVVKLLPMPVHLALDAASGALLAVLALALRLRQVRYTLLAAARAREC